MDQIKYKNRYFGDQSIDVSVHAQLSASISHFKTQYLRTKIELIAKRKAAQNKYDLEAIPAEQRHQLEAYIYETEKWDKEMEALLVIFDQSQSCSRLVEHIWTNRMSIEALDNNPTAFLNINQDFDMFVTDCNELGIADENGLNLEIRKAQLKLLKPQFDRIWKYLQKIIFTSSL